MTEITNAESGASVRTKLNAALAKTDQLATDGNRLEVVNDIAFGGAIVEQNNVIQMPAAPADVALDPALGTHQKITITRAVTFTSSIGDGENITLIMNNTGDPEVYQVTWFTDADTVVWVTDLGGEPTLTANDAVTFWRFGTIIYAAHIGGWQ